MGEDLNVFHQPEIVRLDDVTFRYPNTNIPVIRDVSFHLSVGETVAVVGKSGVGKSTLMKLVSGELKPISGAFWQADTISRPGAIAHVDQASTVFEWMRVNQIMRLCLARRTRSDRAEMMTVEEALAAFGLEGTGGHYPSQISGGMRQRLALAFAVLRNPRMLLLDEPFASVDEFTKETLYRLLQSRLNSTATGVVIITHNINECLTLSDRVIVLGGSLSATVVDTFEVKGPKPRSALMLLEPKFVNLNRDIRTAIATERPETARARRF